MKTRPGAERQALKDLRATVRASKQALAEHAKLCGRCSQATDIRMRCEVWWNLATNMHATKRRLNAFVHADNPDQLPLPGM